MSKHLVHNEVMSESPLEQRPRFERLVRRVAARGLEPYGFERETSRLWTRMASPDVTHEVEWQKGKWTRRSAVTFYVNMRAHWVTGPNVAWPDVAEPVRPLIVSSRLRITSDDPAFDQVTEPSPATSQDRFRLTSEVDEDTVTETLLRLLADQGRPELDRVVSPADCVRELREPDANIPGAEALMRHFAALGDRDQVQEQYWRLRRHFGHRDIPRHPELKAMVAELGLTEPP